MEKIKSVATLLLLLVISTAWGADYSQYTLTELQLDLLDRYEKKGMSQEKLDKIAGAFHRHNTKVKRDEYIPPHTQEELFATRRWARGAAFIEFRAVAGVEFDREAYIADCPNWPMFGFLKHTGTEFVEFDVMKGNVNMTFELGYILRTDPENFKERYLELAEHYDFLKYVTVL